MAASSSSSTSSDPNSNSSFDVFLNHHGRDVKKTFASHLYQRLHSYGLKAFLDQQESQRGDYFTSQIKGAIQAASVHVAIFSVRYAESVWCLNELLWMLESKRTIIPVFYLVKPDELRWPRGVYAEALHKLEDKTTDDPQTHQKTLRHDPSTVEQWRKALHTVSLISGFELEECNGDEGVLLNKVVESVLRNVKKSLDVAKYPTGLDQKITEFENEVLLPHLQSGRKPQILGIVGLGGVGKTTLAKELFNKKSSQYNRCCFLCDVRENVNKGSLISLQSNLLKNLTGTDLQIHNKDEAIGMLKKHLSSHQILLILDDVDKVDQVDALVPNQTSIHSNSLILITSRDRDVLTRSGVEKSSIYKLNGLNIQHSVELFCWHAFRQSYPLPEFEDLTEKFVNACNGLPLSLKVFGALLYGNNDIYYWKEQLDKLERILHSEIEERLRISYDALDVEQKHIFLDIACFFIGENSDTAIRIWNGSGWGGRLGFQTLRNKCLVEVNDRNEIDMHDHLKDLGRIEAHCSQPLRFWRIDDHLLQQSSVITVRGIRMGLSEYDDDEEFDDIQMRKLQLVDTESILLERILRRVKFPDLIWLCWKECPYSSLPSWIPMKNLRVLQVSGSKLETLWQTESQAPLQLPVCLEELRVDGCQQLKSIQGLAQLTKLQRLDLGGRTELEELPKHQRLRRFDLGDELKSQRTKLEELKWLGLAACSNLEELPSMEILSSLESLMAKTQRYLEHATKFKLLGPLSVRACTELEELPNMGTLVSLEQFWAPGCVKLRNIHGLEHATKLQQLNVGGCTELEELPNIKKLVSLEQLWASRCVKLKSIRGLEHAAKLQKLNVDGCTKLEELPNMETLVSLEQLLAEGCVKLKSICGLEHATKLQHINVGGCTELEELPNMERLVSLEQLSAQGCVKLKSIRGLERATKLEQLNVGGCTELEELPKMERLVSLEALWASGCVKLKSIQGLKQATELRLLDVTGCTKLEELPNMETSVSLEEFLAEGCVTLKSIRGLEHATKLKLLNVGRCTELEELPSMETLVSLEQLWAEGCVKLKSISGLERTRKLKSLHVGRCTELEEVPNMETLVSLEQLWVQGCVKLKSIRGLEHVTKLQKLDVRGCSELKKLPNMENLVSLDSLGAEGCMKLKSIRGLEHATKIRWLRVGGCSELEELPNMETLVSLVEFSSPRCMKLKSIRGLEDATKLQNLDVSGSSKLEKLPNMERLVSLEALRAEGCVKLTSIRGLEQLTKLQRLIINGCSELEELPNMESLISLKQLWARGCVKLKNIRGLLQCKQLECLNVRWCYELEVVEDVEYCTWLKMLDVSICPKLQCPVWE